MTLTLPQPIEGHTVFTVTWIRDVADQASVSPVPVDDPENTGFLSASYVCQVSDWSNPEPEIRAGLVRFEQWSNATFSA